MLNYTGSSPVPSTTFGEIMDNDYCKYDDDFWECNNLRYAGVNDGFAFYYCTTCGREMFVETDEKGNEI